MKYLKSILMLTLTVAFFTATGHAGDYQLHWLCINSGGEVEQSSTNFKARLTFGQAVAGYCDSDNYKAFLGFWRGSSDLTSDVEQIFTLNLPTDFNLRQNYPNPFNPTTVIEFALPRSGMVNISVFNTLGQKITTLVDELLHVGVYRTVWDGEDQNGRQVASGVYFYRIETEEFVSSKKMLLLK